jgi:hypothetical protein
VLRTFDVSLPPAFKSYCTAGASRAAGGLGRRIAAMRLLEGQKLKPGRDIFGSGTANDPFRFRPGLLYHDAYYHWLKQEGIQVCSRRVEQFGGGIGDRIETADGRVLYFLNDKLALE